MSGVMVAHAIVAALLPAPPPPLSTPSVAPLAPGHPSIWSRVRLSPSELAVAPSLERIRSGTADRSDERRLEVAVLGLTRGALPSDPRAVVLLLHLVRRLAAASPEWALPPLMAKSSLESALRRPLGGALRQLAHFELALLALGRTLGSAPSPVQTPESELELQGHVTQVIWGAEEDEWCAVGLLLEGLLAWEQENHLVARRDFEAALTLQVPQRQKAEIALLIALLEAERGEESNAVRWFDGAAAMLGGTPQVSGVAFGSELPWDPQLRRYLSEWPSWRRPGRLDASHGIDPANELVSIPVASSPFFRAARSLQRILSKSAGEEAQAGSPDGSGASQL